MFQNTFPADELMAQQTARMLLEVKAVHFRADDPYKLTSGLLSPVYIDCRKLISYPRIRSALMDFAVSKLMRDAGFEAFTNIAGGETAGAGGGKLWLGRDLHAAGAAARRHGLCRRGRGAARMRRRGVGR